MGPSLRLVHTGGVAHVILPTSPSTSGGYGGDQTSTGLANTVVYVAIIVSVTSLFITFNRSYTVGFYVNVCMWQIIAYINLVFRKECKSCLPEIYSFFVIEQLTDTSFTSLSLNGDIV